MGVPYSRARAGRWFLHSGIQEPGGGVARYYRADIQKNEPVSTEITGYFASTMVFLYTRTGSEEYLDAARRAANFLCGQAWNPVLKTFPFEFPATRAYFFDCGIIVRGLLAVWRVTKEQRLLDLAAEASRGMIRDFDFQPVISLPDKRPLPPEAHWSRAPGCFQLKSALGWWEVAEITGDASLRNAYFEALRRAIEGHRDFLPGSSDNGAIMDRLHPYLYFLEGLSPVRDRPECAEALRYGVETVGRYLAAIAPEFVRSDVYAQLLRARGEDCGEAAALAEFQAESGGFLFGRRAGRPIPHENPVSTAFAIQALDGDAGPPI